MNGGSIAGIDRNLSVGLCRATMLARTRGLCLAVLRIHVCLNVYHALTLSFALVPSTPRIAATDREPHGTNLEYMVIHRRLATKCDTSISCSSTTAA